MPDTTQPVDPARREAARDLDAVRGVDADAVVVRGGEPPSSRRPLDREQIVLTGLAFIDRQGLAGLSMRRLGNALGVEAMALYRHVPGKEDLLDAIVEALVAEMRDDSQVLDSPEHGWQDFIQRLAHGVRRIALAHPRAFPLVASRPPEAPWLRPPLRSLEWVETFLQGLLAEGFTRGAAVSAYRAFTSFLLGHLLLEVANHDADIGPLDTLEDPDGSSLEGFPAVQALGSALAEDHADVEFEVALESLLERLQLLRLESTDDEAQRPG